jgi:chromate reductase, NAD(P)H dehydrogenase (quinone)
MMRVAALCGSRRRGSFNRMLLENAIARAPEGMEIVEVDIRDFPFFDQDAEKDPPPAVIDAKHLIQSADCLLLVSPEYDYGVPGYLKNAVDWLSRPFGDPTLGGRPMAVMGASTGYMGTIRGQLHWRQSWHFFRAPVFSDAELTIAFAADAFAENRTLVNEKYVVNLDNFLTRLHAWLERDCSPQVATAPR